MHWEVSNLNFSTVLNIDCQLVDLVSSFDLLFAQGSSHSLHPIKLC